MTRPWTVGLVRPQSRVARRPWTVLADIRAAVGFLTRLPVSVPAADGDRTGAGAFGLVGAAIGLLAAVPVVLLAPHLALPAAVLALLVNVIASGGLHLDGLADTADALAAPTPDAAERARTDPRTGAAGVAALVLDLLLAATLLKSLIHITEPTRRVVISNALFWL
jgi:adenosylcobinamide-GDP ribazoletransferase